MVLGGGLVGCETGLFLATEAGKKVTILEMLPEVATDEMHLTRDALLDRLNEHTTVITKRPLHRHHCQRGHLCGRRRQ